MADLDLSTGDPARADEDTPAGRRRRRRREEGESTPRPSKTDAEIRAGLNHAFEKLAQNRYAKEDPELGDALTEEGPAMTEGIVDLTDKVPVFRQPILVILNLCIVLLAFGRVGGILFDRAQQRRAAAMAARAEQQEAVEIIEN